MKTITLTRGKVAVVSDEDFEFLNRWKWRAMRAGRKQTKCVWYAHRTTERPNRKGIYMHREVLRRCGSQESHQCDHLDSDGLNNQRQNLRPATASQNRWNMRKRTGRSSRYKGVYWNRKAEKWFSRIMFRATYKWLGSFDSEIAAGKAYDAAAVRFFGQFARLNFNTP